MLENSYSMKIVYVKKKIAGASRRKQAISSHIPYCLVSFLGGPFKFTVDGLKKYLDVSTHSARRSKSPALP